MVKSKTSAKNKKLSKKTKLLMKKNLLYVIPIFVLLLISGFGGYRYWSNYLGPQLPPPPSDALYKQSTAPIDKRVEDLLSRMTLEEKIGQMSLVDKNSLIEIQDISRYSLGGILSGAGAKFDDNSPEGWAKAVNEMKSQADKSRLQIPILYGVDANHGNSNVPGATIFPHSINLGSSQDSELVEQIAKATADEIRATGANWSFSPSLDAPKDIRWGRVYESFSDDPALNAKLGDAYVAGTQSTKDGRQKIIGSAKHYLATGAMVWGKSNHKTFSIDQGRSEADNQKLDSEYLVPFRAAVDADVGSVMVALNQWGDERMIDSKYLLTDKLKQDLGFKGFVVSDWYGVYEYAGVNNYDANIKSINAGLDMAMLPYNYKDFMSKVREAVNRGRISESRINDAVARILSEKFKAGLFDIKQNKDIDVSGVGSPQNRELARKAVASSAVLLKNNNDLLPLSANSSTKIIVAGSGADNVGIQSGGWTVEWQGIDGNWLEGSTSILEGLKDSIEDEKASVEYDLNGDFSEDTKADVAFVIVSELPYAEGWGDNPNPTITEDDRRAIEKLKSKADRVVLIIVSGRPLMITDEINNADAVVAVWLPGSEGAGVADVIFGKTLFTATLPLPWPRNISQVPVQLDQTTADGTELLFKRYSGIKTN